MEIPLGYKEVYQEAEKDTVLKLQMAMYGLVQAARQYFWIMTANQYFSWNDPGVTLMENQEFWIHEPYALSKFH